MLFILYIKPTLIVLIFAIDDPVILDFKLFDFLIFLKDFFDVGLFAHSSFRFHFCDSEGLKLFGDFEQGADFIPLNISVKIDKLLIFLEIDSIALE